MSNELAAQATMKRLAAEFKAVTEDASTTTAEKELKGEQIVKDMKSASETIKQAADVKRLMGAGESSNFESHESGTKVLRPQGPQSIGEMFTATEVYKNAVNASNQSLHFNASTIVKANEFVDGTYDGTQNVSNFGGTAGPFLYPHIIPGITGINQRPLVVEDFLPSGATESPVVSYIIESAWTNAAGMVAEKGAKPQMTVETFQRVNEPVTKVAQIYKMSDEMMQDQSQVKGWLDSRLLYGLGQKVQQQLLNGTGTLPQLRGLNQRTGLQTTVTSASLNGDTGAWATAILQQITNIRNVGFTEPNAIFVNPYDWSVVQDLKDKNGQYLNGGPWSRSYGNNAPNVASFWALPLVATLDQPQGTALVGNFSDSQVWNRQGITVEMTNSDGTDFQNDIVTVRAERRLGLALYRPLSFGLVTLVA